MIRSWQVGEETECVDMKIKNAYLKSVMFPFFKMLRFLNSVLTVKILRGNQSRSTSS